VAPDAATLDAAALDAEAPDSSHPGAADGGSDGGSDASTDSGSQIDSSTPADAGDAAACVDLTVKNFITWCSFSVAGGTPSIAAQETVCVTPGTIQLAATARNGFELGADPWHDVTGDTGSGVPGTRTSPGGLPTSSTTVTVVAGTPKCVWVCCETMGTTDCNGLPDQCP
jgi:hypothetical protein